MAFGFPPKYSEEFSESDFSNEQSKAIVLETLKTLKWKVGEISNKKILAYTSMSLSSWGEEITIEVDVPTILIESKCTGSQLLDWGKNKSNIEQFCEAYDEVAKETNLETLSKLGQELQNTIPPAQTDLTEAKENKFNEFISIFKIQKNYVITPILVNLNIAVFILMVLSGANIFLPSTETILNWGGNFRPLTLENEWWRLISSCFIHIGIFHLLMNMYALLYIGLLLEPLLGNVRFSVAYVLSGLTGSVASLYWHEMTVSAGASGAIFGLYGVFLAMLTTKLIEEEKRKALLTSIGIFVVFNLMNGLNGNIDNAAHIGGLIGGLFIGYSYSLTLKKPDNGKLKFSIIAFVTASIFMVSILIYKNTSADLQVYQKKMESFSALEQEAIQSIQFPEVPLKGIALYALRQRGIPKWNEAIQLVNEMDMLQLPDSYHRRNQLLKKYCEIRIKSYEYLCKMFERNGDENSLESRMINQQLEDVMREIEHSFKDN